MIRWLAEAVGVALLAASVFAVGVFTAIGGPRAMVVVFAIWLAIESAKWLALRLLARTLAPRLRFDLWLFAWIPALALTIGACAWRWPIRTRGFDAHGYGTSGGEQNLFLAPAFHALALAALLCGAHAARRRARSAAA